MDFIPAFLKKTETLESWVADKNEKNTFSVFFFLALCPRSLISKCFSCSEPGVGEEYLGMSSGNFSVQNLWVQVKPIYNFETLL